MYACLSIYSYLYVGLCTCMYYVYYTYASISFSVYVCVNICAFGVPVYAYLFICRVVCIVCIVRMHPLASVCMCVRTYVYWVCMHACLSNWYEGLYACMHYVYTYTSNMYACVCVGVSDVFIYVLVGTYVQVYGTVVCIHVYVVVCKYIHNMFVCVRYTSIYVCTFLRLYPSTEN